MFGKEKVGKRSLRRLGRRRAVGDQVKIARGSQSGRTGTLVGQNRRKKPLVQVETGDVVKTRGWKLKKNKKA